jgi:hypothetical protein
MNQVIKKTNPKLLQIKYDNEAILISHQNKKKEFH